MKSSLRFAISDVWVLIALLLILAGSPMWAQTNAVPFVNQPLVPTSTAPGGPGFTLTVNGTGFVSGSTVNWNGNALATNFVNSSQLTATVLAADIAQPATVVITVTSPSPGGGVSNLVFFPVSSKAPSISFVNAQILTLSTTNPSSVAVGDFNEDGKLDMAVANGSVLSVFLGNGDGTFQPRVDYATILNPIEVIAADLRGNGTLDLAVVNRGQISVLLGNGDGTFQPHVDYSGYLSEAFNIGSIVAADLNADGKLDLAAAWACQSCLPVSFAGATSVFLGNGDGTFQPYINTSSVPNDEWLAAGDFNHDGKLDLAGSRLPCSSDDCNMLTELGLGNGDGTFTLSFSEQDGELASQSSVAAADLNGDGNLDSIVCNGTTLSVLLGKGDGTFQPPIATSVGCFALAVGDLHGNSFLDLALAGYPTASVLSGTATGQFVLGPTLPSPDIVEGIAVGDFNGDGRLDVVLVGESDVGGSNVGKIWVDLQQDPGVAVLSPTSLSFGAVLVGKTSTAQPVILTNTGVSPLSVNSITMSTQFNQTNNCPVGGSLKSEANCSINVTFGPTTGENATGTLSVVNNGPVSPTTLALTGIGQVGQDFYWGSPLSPVSQTVSPGQTANYSLSLLPIGGFNQNVQVSCNGAPAGATCTLTPSPVAVNTSSSATVAVAIATTGGAAASLAPPSGLRPVRSRLALWVTISGVPGLMVLGGIGWPRKRKLGVRHGLAILCLFFVVVTWSACGGGGGTSGGATTPPGTYPITVTGSYTGSGGTLMHTTKLTLVVN